MQGNAAKADSAGQTSQIADWLRGQLPESPLSQGFLLETWQWIGLTALITLGVIADRVTRFLVSGWLSRSGRKPDAVPLNTEAIKGFATPLGVFVMGVVWRSLLGLLDLPTGTHDLLHTAATFVMAAAGVWTAYRFVDLLATYLEPKVEKTDSQLDDLLVPLVRRALKIVVLAFGLVFVAQNLNVQVTSLIAGLGLGGLALAMAAKDTIENLFGSVAVIIDRPFRIGDWVKVDEVEGTVEEVGFRSTRVRTFYNSVITVPNSLLVRASVDNLGLRQYRRFKTIIGVEYGTPIEKIEAMCEGIRELIRKHPYTRKDMYLVYFNDFGPSSLNILLYVFFETPDWPTELRERDRLLVGIVRLAKQLGVSFAFPTQTVHVASAPPNWSGQPASESQQEGRSSTESEQAFLLGREQAEQIVERSWGSSPQPPVDFDLPERTRPGRA